MRILVTGSRDGFSALTVKQTLLQAIKDFAGDDEPLPALMNKTVIVHGGARGVDTWAGEFAHEYGAISEVHEADWEGLGKKAGYVRNHKMLDSDIDLVIGFVGLCRSKTCVRVEAHGSHGASDTVQTAFQRGMNVRVFAESGQEL